MKVGLFVPWYIDAFFPLPLRENSHPGFRSPKKPQGTIAHGRSFGLPTFKRLNRRSTTLDIPNRTKPE